MRSSAVKSNSQGRSPSVVSFLVSGKRIFGSLGCFGAVMVAYSLSATCFTFAQGKTAALPVAGGPAATPVATGPIDIQADQQDFAGDVVFARGNVRVVYKDSVITGPEAQLFKDPNGQPQMAIFSGHPHLVQKQGNKIQADKLVFEMAVNKIVADGHAHSEVSGDSNAPPEPESLPLPAKASKPSPNTAFTQPKPTAVAKLTKKTEGSDWQMDEEAQDSPAIAKSPPDGSPESKPKDAVPAKPAEKIIVDSEHQEYEQDTGHFVAIGHCKVKHGDMNVNSNALNLVYGADGKPETALFSGSVNATQNGNNTKAEHMTYSLSTQRLQASGNVRSKVIQQRPATSEPKKGAQSDLTTNNEGKVKVRTSDGTIKELSRAEAERYGFKTEEEKKKKKTFELTMNSEEPIYIISDSQDYTKENGRMTALGNVHVYYNENKGLGHKVLLIRNEEGKAERLIFTGRSQIIQPGKRWIGDKITFLVPSEHVITEGNSRAIILNTNAQVAQKLETSSEETSMQEVDTNASSQVEAQLAKDINVDNKDLGTAKVDSTQ